MLSWVAVAVAARMTSRHRPNWAVSAWLVPMPTWPAVQVGSVSVATVAPSICAVIVVPENVSARLCHVLVPGVLDALLGPADPPGHGRLRYQERAGDLRGGQ